MKTKHIVYIITEKLKQKQYKTTTIKWDVWFQDTWLQQVETKKKNDVSNAIKQ